MERRRGKGIPFKTNWNYYDYNQEPTEVPPYPGIFEALWPHFRYDMHSRKAARRLTTSLRAQIKSGSKI